MILDTLSNGLKDLFAALGAKTTDSNYAVPLLNKTNGTPQGMMDMSSLASVLGVNGQLSNNVSFDSLTHNGNWYVVSGTHPEAPTSGTGVLVCKFASSTYGYQMFKTSGATHIRHYFGGWAEEWQRLDNFGCNTPESLASLLGVPTSRGTVATGTDLNDVTALGLYVLSSANTYSNKPSLTGSMRMRVTVDGGCIIQQAYNDYGIMIRLRWGDSFWTPWKSMVSFT